MNLKIERWINKWESMGYEDGIPDEAPCKLEMLDLVPSYKRICIAILKNDICLTSLGYSRPKSELYSVLKKIEIEGRK